MVLKIHILVVYIRIIEIVHKVWHFKRIENRLSFRRKQNKTLATCQETKCIFSWKTLQYIYMIIFVLRFEIWFKLYTDNFNINFLVYYPYIIQVQYIICLVNFYIVTIIHGYACLTSRCEIRKCQKRYDCDCKPQVFPILRDTQNLKNH